MQDRSYLQSRSGYQRSSRMARRLRARVWTAALIKLCSVRGALFAWPAEAQSADKAMPFLVNRLQPQRLYVAPPTPWGPLYYGLLGNVGDSTANYVSPLTVSYHSVPRFKPDGTSYYALNSTDLLVYQYEMTTPWEINTARSYGKFLSISSLVTGGSVWRNITFLPDGSKVFLITSQNVYPCTLSTPWDITTATWLGTSTTIPTNNSCYDIKFNNDGTKMYTVADTTDAIQSYTLSTPYDPTTATYDSISFPVGFGETLPKGVMFEPTGTKMYVIGDNNRLTRYTLGVAWDLTTAAFDNYFFNTAYLFGGYKQLLGMEFSPDGTSLYISAFTNGVYQLRLSTPYDLTTATYKPGIMYAEDQYDTFNVPNAEALAFNNTGTKVYFLNNLGTAQYSVATPWDLSTISFDNKMGNTYKYAGATPIEPYNLAFNNDGTKAYTYLSTTVYEHNLFEAWNIDTLYRTGVTYNTSTQTSTNARGLNFSADGTKMYIMRTGSSYAVHQYTLATPWDIATLSYSGLSASIAAQTTNPKGLAFALNGTKMYVSGNGFIIYQYTLGTAWNISTATYDNVSYDVPELFSSPDDNLLITNDGTKMYATGYSEDPEDPPNTLLFTHQYTLGTPGDVSTATYDNFKTPGNTDDKNSYIFHIDSDGSNYYTILNGDVYKVALTTPWDIDTSVAVSSINLGAYEFSDGEVSTNGTKMYLLNRLTSVILEYTLSVPNDPMSAVYNAQYALPTNATRMAFSNNGTSFNTFGSVGAQYSLGTPWDITTAVVAGTPGINPDQYLDNGNVGIARTSAISQYSLNPAYNILPSSTIAVQSSYFLSTATGFTNHNALVIPDSDNRKVYVNSTESILQLQVIDPKPIAPWELVPYRFKVDAFVTGFSTSQSIRFSPTGLQMYLLTASNIVQQYELSTAWDVSTAVHASSFSVNTEQTTARGMFFKPDGTIMYICGSVSSNIHQYSLGTPWDISTAAYGGLVISVATNAGGPGDLYISPTGTTMYVLSTTLTRLVLYTLGTPWDITTAAFSATSNVQTYIFTTFHGLTVDPTGTLLFISGHRNLQQDRVISYRVDTPWTLTGFKINGHAVIGLSSAANGIEFDSTGRKLYVAEGASAGRVFTYYTVPPN